MTTKFFNYSAWRDTADTLHMYLQIAGKVKLERSDNRPEWAHARMYLTVDGLTTGLIPGNHSPFEIAFNFREHRVEVHDSAGKYLIIPLHDGLTVARFYEQITLGLRYIGSPTYINVRPQEFYDPVEFDLDEKHHSYDKEAVSLFFDNLLFAYRPLTQFMAPFRGKINNPAYYFGTMDLSCTVYSGEPAPYSRPEASISAPAFDERYVELGFWPGDYHSEAPSFYVLPYPFLSSLEGHEKLLTPEKAIFSPEKKEFFLTLNDALSYDDPVKIIVEFFRGSFEIVQQIKPWEQLEWLTEPLHYEKKKGK